jgi:hypothetical protein
MEERGEEFAGPLEPARTRAYTALNAAMMADFGGLPMTAEPE